MSKPLTPKVEIEESAKTEVSGTKVLTKSGWPKTPKETITMVINFFPF